MEAELNIRSMSERDINVLCEFKYIICFVFWCIYYVVFWCVAVLFWCIYSSVNQPCSVVFIMYFGMNQTRSGAFLISGVKQPCSGVFIMYSGV